jgi:hypothetical protein
MSKWAIKNLNTSFSFPFSPLLNFGEFSRKRKGGLPLKNALGNLIPYQVISEQSLSAGYGNGYTDEQETYTVYWDKDVRYDYAAEIEGNSMEPKFHSGDIALIRKTHVNDYDGCV